MELEEHFVRLPLSSDLDVKAPSVDSLQNCFRDVLLDCKETVNQAVQHKWRSFEIQKDAILKYQKDRSLLMSKEKKELIDRTTNLQRAIEEKKERLGELAKKISEMAKDIAKKEEEERTLETNLNNKRGLVNAKMEGLQRTIKCLNVAISWYLRFMGIFIQVQSTTDDSTTVAVSFGSYDGEFHADPQSSIISISPNGFTIEDSNDILNQTEIIAWLCSERRRWKTAMENHSETRTFY